MILALPHRLVRFLQPLLPGRVWKRARRWYRGRLMPAMVLQVVDERLTYLDYAALGDLFDAVAAAESRNLPGLIVEAGCGLGGSALVMASAKARDREMRIYDVFGFPPPPCERDGSDVHLRWNEIVGGRSPGIKDDTYYGYRPELLSQVKATFRRHGFASEDGVEFIQGLLQDTLRIEGPVAVAHIDCDRYASVRTCLEIIAPRLAPGGVMIIDDYDSKSGCRIAVDEFLSGAGSADYAVARKSRVHITRLSAPVAP